VRIALAAGAAFSFAYPDNTEALEAAGAEIVPFDPVTDPGLPERVGALVVGGGFPEIYARQLGANRRMLDDVRRRVAGGLVTWAECAGLLWLGRALDGVSMVGALPCEGRMTDRLTLGYRSVRTGAASPLGPAGTVLRGHEFHYSVTDPPGDGLGTVGGYVTPTLAASYLHLHLGAAPDVATALVGAARRFTSATPKVRQV
jgi:cobyrinic acid a,c-diamide synthase